ncbi:crotonase/enoyl-CoA hydratase family protein [Deltaproteobacteria bacterium TL4]
METTYETLKVHIEDHVAQIELHRPDKANAMNRPMWKELKAVFQWVDTYDEARVVILSGAGKHFTAGIDLEMLMGLGQEIDKGTCDGRKRENLRRLVLDLQDTFTVIEKCRKPVLAAIHNGCIGGGIDMVSACDMRYCSEDANFCIKEIKLGITADVGTLQRLPRLIPDGMMRELAYTGRTLYAQEAKQIGLVNQVFKDHETLRQEVRKIAIQIAENSPLALRGSKEMILYVRDHSVEDGLNYIATWNAAMALSDDLQEAMLANMSNRKPEFQN